jgi:hypothetical protein
VRIAPAGGLTDAEVIYRDLFLAIDKFPDAMQPETMALVSPPRPSLSCSLWLLRRQARVGMHG